jgi:hypothetical protein
MKAVASIARAHRQAIMRAVVHLHAFGSRQGNAGIVAYSLQDVRQEEILGVVSDVQQEPCGGCTNQHPEVPAAVRKCFSVLSPPCRNLHIPKQEQVVGHPTKHKAEAILNNA